MNMLKLFGGYPDSDRELLPLMREIEEEVKPFQVISYELDGDSIIRGCTGKDLPRGVRLKADDAGNVWLSSRKEGKNYDVIPASDIDRLIAERLKLIDVVGVIAINRKDDYGRSCDTVFRIVGLATDDATREAAEWHRERSGGLGLFYLCEPALTFRVYRDHVTSFRSLDL